MHWLPRIKRIIHKHVLLFESVNLLLIMSLVHFLIIKLNARSMAREITRIFENSQELLLLYEISFRILSIRFYIEIHNIKYLK